MTKSKTSRVRPKDAQASLVSDLVGSILTGDAADIMASWPDSCIDSVITSPPYWTAVTYEGESGQWQSYDAYLDDMQRVWNQCARVLRPNGKLCINTPIMPIPKNMIKQHTRHIKNIAFDMERKILDLTDMQRYSLFIWQKQTSKMMFGSYPYPGNLIENNTIEFINIYVKPGAPPKYDSKTKEENKLSRSEWLDLIQQCWFMYPEDVRRIEGHPAPFPEKLPGRLMKLYSYGASASYLGDIILDPFVGTGTTCAVAKAMKRRWIGIDISEVYSAYARERVVAKAIEMPLILVGRPKYPTKAELLESYDPSAGGTETVSKHKTKRYGRKIVRKDSRQPRLV